MKIRLLSDLHLEFEHKVHKDQHLSIPILPTDSDTVLVLAGDIGNAKKKGTYVPLVTDASARFKKVIFVLGNHEFYGTSFVRAYDKISENLSHLSNVHVMNNETITIDDVVFICSTMWASVDNNDPLMILNARNEMNDYKCIRNGPKQAPYMRKLDPQDTVVAFIEAKKFIFDELLKYKDTKITTVVVTHHACSHQSIGPIFQGDKMNPMYATELGYDMLDVDGPTIWLHGHLHNSMDYTIGDTRIVINPRGYVHVPTMMNANFDLNLILDI